MSKKILVIDDDEAIRKSFVLSLEDRGYVVDTAEGGEIGLQMLKETNYDLIFLDLKMPGMNGVETLREIVKVALKVKVYIVTAFHQEFFGQLKEAEADGIDFQLLRKPIDSEGIALISKAVLEGPVSIE